jgi:hypothetical protein
VNTVAITAIQAQQLEESNSSDNQTREHA